MAICTSCNKEVEGGVKFCTYCGAPVGGDAPVPAGAPDGGGDKEDAVSGVKKFFKKLELAGKDDEKALLTNFILPDDGKALLEFVLAASSRIAFDKYGDESLNYDEWMAKVREASAKAKITAGGDRALLDRINGIVTGIRVNEAAAKLKKKKKMLMIAAGVVALLVAWCIFEAVTDSISEASNKKKIQAEIQRLEILQTDVLNHIKDGNLVEAKLKAVDLKWSFTWTSKKDVETWDERRQMLLQEIENAERKK
ncbi:MAG: zinc ribbon domain-containing protein [Treponema sp.]|jgi:putative component of toxin-antitoxin plasmid stabilization module|nr:zinc ribbon domain-containing protein [Treponema sp.]